MEERKVSESKTVQTYLLMPAHLNSANVLFGGQLMSWIDMLAGIVAKRHADSNVVTVSVDRLLFKNSAYASDVVTLEGRVTWVGNTSMEVRIDSYRESRAGEKILINTAFVVMVALDADGKPRQVPRLILETEEEKREWEAGERRATLRKQSKDDYR